MDMVNTEPTLASDATVRDLLQRHAAWWRREASLTTFVEGVPLGDLWLPLSDGTLAQEDVDLSPELINLERVAGLVQSPGPLGIQGDLLCVADPYGKVPWVEAILGVPVRATIHGGSMRTHHFIDSLQGWESLKSHRNKSWFNLLMLLTELMASRSNGRYAIVQPTMRGPTDLAEAILGPVSMSYAMYDEPQRFMHFLDEVTTVFIDVLQELLRRFSSIAGGYVSPFGIWAPGTVVRTQCDASVFLSPDQYAHFFLPHDLRICQSVTYSFMHLHSVSLHTIDSLLAQDRPYAIQITVEAEPKGPSLHQMLPTLRRILSAKPLLLEGQFTEDQVHWLQDQLPNGGLAISARRNSW